MRWTPAKCIGPDSFDREVEPFEVGDETLEAAGRAVDSRHSGPGGRELCRLPARSGAQVDHLASGDIAKEARRQRRGRILNPPGPLAVTRQVCESATCGPAQGSGRQQDSVKRSAP